MVSVYDDRVESHCRSGDHAIHQLCSILPGLRIQNAQTIGGWISLVMVFQVLKQRAVAPGTFHSSPSKFDIVLTTKQLQNS